MLRPDIYSIKETPEFLLLMLTCACVKDIKFVVKELQRVKGPVIRLGIACSSADVNIKASHFEELVRWCYSYSGRQCLVEVVLHVAIPTFCRYLNPICL